MHVKKETFTGEGVSWTDKPLDYFIHTIDRGKLARYYEQQSQRRAKGMDVDGSDGESSGDNIPRAKRKKRSKSYSR
eukprot:Pgem_evm1s16911